MGIQSGASNSKMIQRLLTINELCHQLNANRLLRNSIPLKMDDKEEIAPLLHHLIAGSEEWRAMRIVVLGHGRIGKTALIREVKAILNTTPDCTVSFPF